MYRSSFKDYLEPCRDLYGSNRLSQLMINLLNNAMKFTQAGLISFGYKLRDDNTLLVLCRGYGLRNPGE